MITAWSARCCSRRMNQLPLISAVPMRSDNALAGSGIFDDVMVQSHDPAGARILSGGYLEGAGLFGRYQAERIGERKMRLGVGVQHDDPQPIVRVRRHDHGKDRRPQTRPTISTDAPIRCRRRRPCRRRAVSARRRGCRRVRPALLSTTWSRVPCSMPSAEIVRT